MRAADTNLLVRYFTADDPRQVAIADALARLLGQALFEVERELRVRRALKSFDTGRGGLTDYLIGELAREAGCRDTVTLDKALKNSAGFTIL